MASRLLLLLLGARQAAAAPTCLRDVANSSSRVPCRCADSSAERWAFVSCNWPVLDGGFKEQGWNGLVLAGANNSACVEAVLTSSSGPDCTTAAVEQAVALVSTYTAIYSAGFELGDGIKAAALSHPEINFATADVAFSSDLPNLQGILFAEEQAAFLAGYLAGLVTSTGVVGAVLGPEIAPVIRFANGFTNGALEACALLGKSCISIRKYIPSFGDGERGWRVAELLSLRGADVIFEAGGYTGACGVAGASSLASVRAVVGVDVDRYLQPNACALVVVNVSKVITSAVKRIDQAIIQVAQSQLDNVFTAGDKIFAADRDAIGISPCHDACSIALDCGSVSCSVASTGVGTTVASAREHILSTIFPAFASGDSILANTRVNAADGSVVHDFGVPNERTQLSVSSTARWAQVGALGVGLALSGHTSVTIELFDPFGGEAGGRPKVIIFGGQTTGGYSNELLMFIPDDSTYSFMDGANGTYGAPAPRADHSTILDGNNVMWVFFGRTASGVAGDVWSIDLSASQNVWVEHVRTGSAGVGIEREGHSSCLFNDGRQALIFGGVAASGSMRNDLWIFDLQTHSWAEVVATYRPAARRKHTATVIGEKMYIFGGTNAQRDELVDLWAYASGDGWVLLTPSTPSSLLPRWNHAAVVWNTQTEGPLLAITGGQSGTSLLDDLHVYSPSANSWTKRLSFGAHVHKHSAHSAAEIGGRIYMISGIVQTTTGSAGRTADIYVHNADEPLEPPSLVSATTNTITLGWYASNSYTQGGSDSCSCFASIVSEYQLQLVSRGGYTTLYYGDLTSFTVQGLESGSAYEFRIRGGGILGFTGWSAGITHNTTRLSKVAQPVTEVRVGILLPLFGLDGGSQSWSPRVGVYQAIRFTRLAWSPRAGVYQALREINNKTDGVEDHLLPNTQLLYAYRDSKCDSSEALQGALHLTQDAFGGAGVDVIIGAGCSGASGSAAAAAIGLRVPIISPSSHSPALSSNAFFCRTCASDKIITFAMVDLLRNLFQYSTVALISSSFPYAVGAASAFRDAAVHSSLSLSTSLSFDVGNPEFASLYSILKRTRSSVLVMFAQGFEGAQFILGAYQAGLGGEGYLWMVGDPSLVDSFFWNDNTTLQDQVLRGLFSVVSSADDQLKRYKDFVARRHRLPHLTVRDGGCSLERDSENSAYLWAQDHDGNDSTPLKCDHRETLSSYDPFGYDAVIAVGYALHFLIEEQGRHKITGSELMDTLLNHVSFEGVSGLMEMSAVDSSATAKGDRSTGSICKLVNFVDSDRGTVTVGSWQPCTSQTCDWESRWTSLGIQLTYSTTDNQRPPGQGSCPYGEDFVPSINQCDCLDGFERALDSNDCRPCPTGQYSLHSLNSSSSTGCTICDQGYFRLNSEAPSSHAPATACISCADIWGVSCTFNSTIHTLWLIPGAWRLSAISLEVVGCDSYTDGNSLLSPCMGGSDAGLEGAGYCREGHAGPRCALCTNSSQYYSEGTCIDCPDAQNRAMISLLTALAVLVFVVSSRAAFSRCAPVSYRLNIRRLRRLMAWLSAIAFVPKFKLVIGFVQTVKLLPDVYALELPRFYYDWVGFLSAFQIDWSNMIYPGSCLNGGYLSLLLLRALGPLALMGLFLVIGVAYGVAPQVLGLREGRPPWQQSFIENLPAQLVISFCLIPSTSNSIFAVWTCETFQLDSTVNPPTTVQFLTKDVTLKCVQSDENYSRLLRFAYVFMAMWPVGVPLLFLLVLLNAHSSIQSGNSSNLVRATKFLHREYVKEFHWWEVLFLLQRLVIVGFARLISHGPHRLLFGTLIALLYFGALLVVKPYKRSDVGLIACSCQIIIVLLLYMSTYAFQLHSLHEAEDVEGQSDLSWSITGFRDIDHLSAVVIVILLGYLAGLLMLTLYQLFASYDSAVLLLVSNRQPPELVMDAGKQYHLFLSHTWSSGQDQVATIKRRLQLLLTGCRIFLDVDDLDQIAKLEEYVDVSEAILVFLSKGYFYSVNCLRELDYALCVRKPLVLVHEVDEAKGGAPLSVLRQDCVLQDRDAPSLFDEGREVIVWHRIAAFQQLCLIRIAQGMLHALAPYRDVVSPPAVYIVGDLLMHQNFVFPRQICLYVSASNYGGTAMVRELLARYQSKSLTVQHRVSKKFEKEVELFYRKWKNIQSSPCKRMHSWETLREAVRRRSSGPLYRASAMMKGATPALQAHDSIPTHMLLYLNHRTFTGKTGQKLAGEVRQALIERLQIVLVHENDEDRDGCPFSRMFESTPDYLINAGIYQKLAISLLPMPYRNISLALVAKALGAIERPKTVAPFCVSLRNRKGRPDAAAA